MYALESPGRIGYTPSKRISVDYGLGVEMSHPSVQITRLLQAWGDGEKEALDQLMPLVFDDLRRMASRYLRRERFHTLQSTALVNEVFLRLLNRRSLEWRNRSQFFGFVAQEMRRILVDYARKKKSARRGAGGHSVSLDEALAVAESRDIDLLALDDALGDLARLDSDLSRVVELRFFVGLSYDEIAELLGTSKSTIRRRWRSASAWLYRELAEETRAPAASSGDDRPIAAGTDSFLAGSEPLTPSDDGSKARRGGTTVDSAQQGDER